MLQKWFKFGVLIPLLGLLCFGGNVRGQTETPEQIITIRVIVNDGWEQNVRYVENLLAAVRENLTEYDIRLEEWKDSDEPQPQPNLVLNHDLTIDQTNLQTTIGLVQFEGGIIYHLNELSPMLFYNYNVYPGGIEYNLRWNEADAPTVFAANTNLLTGLALYLGDFPAEAATFFTQATFESATSEGINQTTNAIFLNFLQANCALLAGDFDSALILLEASVAELNLEGDVLTYRGVFNNLAWLYLQLDRETEAFIIMDAIVAAAAISPFDESQAISYRAQLYALAFQYDEAIADMDAAIEIAAQMPQSDWNNLQLAKLYVLRGNIILLIYEWDRVVADYNTAIELVPDYADAYFFRAVFFYTRAEYTLALVDFNHYLELEPEGEHAQTAFIYVDEIAATIEALSGG